MPCWQHIPSQQPVWSRITVLSSHHKPSMCVHAKSLQSCPSLCDPMGYSPISSSVHGILQAKILEWVAISSSRGSSRPRGQTHVSFVSCIVSCIARHHAPSQMIESWFYSLTDRHQRCTTTHGLPSLSFLVLNWSWIVLFSHFFSRFRLQTNLPSALCLSFPITEVK